MTTEVLHGVTVTESPNSRLWSGGTHSRR